MATAKKTTTAAAVKPTVKKATASKIATPKTPAAQPKAKPASKTVAKAKPAAADKKIATPRKKATPKTASITPEQRHHMIQTAAYFIAEKRGFYGVLSMDDWIVAEAEIDAMLNKS